MSYSYVNRHEGYTITDGLNQLDAAEVVKRLKQRDAMQTELQCLRDDLSNHIVDIDRVAPESK